MKRLRVLLLALRLWFGDRPSQVLRLAQLELAIEDAHDALEPFGLACPPDREAIGYSWSALRGHGVSGLASGVCPADFWRARDVVADLRSITSGASS